MLQFAQPGFLWLLLLAVLPWFWRGQTATLHSGLGLLPRDRLSEWIDTGLRLAAVLTCSCLVVGLAQPYLPGETIRHSGEGARIVLLMDRSSSMGENFSGHYLEGMARESKAVAARRFLAQLVARRPHDLFALLDFSTAPLLAMPMTANPVALQAAIAAISERGHGITALAPALAMALESFGDRVEGGSRIVLLVSDGATRIDQDTRERLRADFQTRQASLYWVYLRTPRSSRLGTPPPNPGESTTPEFFLHRYFEALGVPYRAFEADHPDALEAALTELAAVKSSPWHYTETRPRQELAGLAYALALVAGAVMLAGAWVEQP
ncbi:MAG: hypothetical protein RLZZ226_445 [Pseudomonadota bacterium]|jgi:mxaC protein